MNQWLILIAGVGREHHENMKRICNEQLEILSKVDPGYPSWKGDILKHLSTATMNLARLVRVFSFFFLSFKPVRSMVSLIFFCRIFKTALLQDLNF